MRDINYSLRKAYFSALTGIAYESSVTPVYYLQAPDGIAASNYIVFGGVTNNDLSTKSSANTGTLMRVAVHTFKEKYNDGKAADFIAGEVLQRIYPNSQAGLVLGDNLQMYSTDLVSDLTQDYGIRNSTVYIDRILIFRHKIYQR